MWWWKRRIHYSWAIAVGSAGFVCGVAGALVVQVSFIASLIAGAVLISCLLAARAWAVPMIFLASSIVGVGYGAAHVAERGLYARWIGKTVQVSGRVKEDPSKGASGQTSLQLDAVTLDGVAMAGSIFVSIRGSPGAKRGDIVEGLGKAKDGFANFPISVSLTKITNMSRQELGDTGRVVRDWFADKVRIVVPEPQASLGIGFLTGQKSALPDDLSDALKIAGLTHIVVASGYNLTILVQLARRLLLKVSKYLSALSSSIMILAFMAITGLSPSMTRAGLVSGMSLLSWYYGHAFQPLVLLPVAAAITVILQPSYVWGDLGWQLSFSAFAGVMIVAPLLQTYFFGRKEPGVFRQILGETVAAHLVTIPVIAVSFGTLSNVAIIANILVVPLVPLAMLLTFICGLWVIFSLPFAALIAMPTTWLLGYMTQVATIVSELPWAQSELNVSLLIWGIYTLGLAAACWWMWRKTRVTSADGYGQLRVPNRQTCHQSGRN